MKKIFFINIIVFLVLLVAVEFSFFLYYKKIFCLEKYPFFSKKNIIYNLWLDRFYSCPTDKNFTKKPILLLGCSYTYGQWLNDDENFSAKLQEQTNRYVYNLGSIGQGINIYVALLYFKEILDKINVEPEYVIYTYMFDHVNRVYNWIFYNDYRKHHLTLSQKYHLTDNLVFINYFRNRAFEDEWFESHSREEFFDNIVMSVKNRCDELFPNSKFVILRYSDINYDLCPPLAKPEVKDDFKLLYDENYWKKFEDKGITVLSTEELIGRKMDKPSDRVPSTIDPNHPHPSSEAWDLIVPKLVKKLNL